MTVQSRILLILIGLALPAMAGAWWNDQWGYRKGITLDTSPQGADVATTLANVPVLLRLHTGNFQYFLDVLDGGADLRFIAGDDQTPLKYHVERFDAVNEIALIWVKLPQLAGNANTDKVWMYYSNPAAPKGDDVPGTYDADMALVYHFDEQSGTPTDETAYGNQASAFSGQLVPASLIGGGARFTGSGVLTIPDSASLLATAAKGWTVSTWIRIEGPQTGAILLDRAGTGGHITLRIDGTAVRAALTPTGGSAVETSGAANLVAGTWHHLALVRSANRLSLYLDGAEVAGVDVPAFDVNGPISVGADSAGDGFLTGEIDELEISGIARSAEWLKAAARGQGTDPKLLHYGNDETKESADAGEEQTEQVGYFTVIFQSVFGKKEAIVEQAVIGLCAILAVIALMVMFLKAAYLSGARSASRRFLRAFEALGLDEPTGDASASGTRKELDALYGAKRFRRSPLYHVYCQGIEEVRKRISPAVGAQSAGIDDKALNTIRAAMDAVMVREGQRLDAQMVLLTIAISGGPFIGLLGTVVGVMVTFAAIAATGDVNIAAIAPGMAAALLATVAGLGVAIPSLFGYNYLGSRIKELSADMHVFADELLARINETYGR